MYQTVSKKIDKQHRQIAARFSLASPTYHEHAQVQHHVAERLVTVCSSAGLGQGVDGRVLELGCGTGVFTSLLLKEFPNVFVDAVDISSRMISQARKLIGESPRLQWRVGDASHLPFRRIFSYAVSSSAVHWMQPLEDTFVAVKRSLRPGGKFIFSVMSQGTLDELSETRREVVPEKKPKLALPGLLDVSQMLTRVGFCVEALERENIIVHYEDTRSLLSNLHELGLTGGDLSGSKNLLTRGELVRLMERYDQKYRNGNGMVRATYCVIYISASLTA